MNSRLLYAATLAISLLGTLVMANEPEVAAALPSGARVNADLAWAAPAFARGEN